MPRSYRIKKNGFYHIINRGVAKKSIFHDNEDFLKFLDIVQEASEEYGFKLYSYCLMSNHYHLLLENINQNLSLSLQKINSRYSIYYNKKYKRVGPLWQGRFKSWYVYDVIYMQTLVRYIEFNPIKANITQNIGEYKWAMSSHNFQFSMLNYELIDKTSFDNELDDIELQKIDELYKKKIEIKDDDVAVKELKPINEYFVNNSKEDAIFTAIKDGYTATGIASYLGLSNPSISKIIKIHKQKIALFNKLKAKGIFWSYSKDISYDTSKSNLLIEYALKYADFDDMKLCIKLFGKREVKKVWEKSMKSDQSFIKTNLMIARVFLCMDVEAEYFKEVKNARFEKLRLLAS